MTRYEATMQRLREFEVGEPIDEFGTRKIDLEAFHESERAAGRRPWFDSPRSLVQTTTEIPENHPARTGIRRIVLEDCKQGPADDRIRNSMVKKLALKAIPFERMKAYKREGLSDSEKLVTHYGFSGLDKFRQIVDNEMAAA